MAIYYFGKLLGICILAFYGATLMSFILKRGLKVPLVKAQLKKQPQLNQLYQLAIKVFVRPHRYWGLLAALALGAHFAVQYTNYGFSFTGALAAGCLIAQVLLGIYGVIKKRGQWIWLHRSLAVIMAVAIAIHVI